MESTPHEARSSELIGLIDAHCYYVSCHRLFEPRLKGLPVVVLSNNDSAVVSRSDEAKALGVKMSQPRHELDWLVRNRGLILRSSNYVLYQDLHHRFMAAISSVAGNCCTYSCDEAFISLSGYRGDLDAMGRTIQSHILRAVGLPVGVGISRNRTTAKLCSWASKQWKKQTGSVVALTEYHRLQKLMALADVSEVWGVGRRLTDHLNSYGISTALQLANADAARMKKLHGVGLARTIRELNWDLCIGPEEDMDAKSMTCSRTFSSPVNSFLEVHSSLVTFAAKLGAKLRKQDLLAASVTVFLVPSRASQMTTMPKSATIQLQPATNDTRSLIEAARQLLYGFDPDSGLWIKAGIVIPEVLPLKQYIPDLFIPSERAGSSQLMSAIDRINGLNGAGTVRFGFEKKSLSSILKSRYPSPQSTTRWSDLPVAT